MPRALFVNLKETYPQLSDRTIHSEALRNCTCCWWHVDPESAQGVEFLFGVFEKRVVSAYRVSVPARNWPRMPDPAIGSGRLCVPVEALALADWEVARGWPDIVMSSAIRYGEVMLTTSGGLETANLGTADD